MGAIAEKCLVTFTRSRNEATATGRAGEEAEGWLVACPLTYEGRRRVLSFQGKSQRERERKRERKRDKDR